MAVGGDPDRFWRSTPREFLAFLRGARQRLEAEHRRDAWVVWHNAVLVRTAMVAPKKLPTFASFVKQVAKPLKERRRRQTIAEMEAALVAWFGPDPGKEQ